MKRDKIILTVVGVGVVVLSILAFLLLRSAHSLEGTWAYLTREDLACESKETLQELVALWRSGDEEALYRKISKELQRWECTLLLISSPEGREVYVLAHDLQHNMAQIRFKGETTKFWVLDRALRAR